MEFDDFLKILQCETMLFSELFKSFVVFLDIVLVLFSHFLLVLFRQFTKNLIFCSKSMVNKGPFCPKFRFWNDEIFLHFGMFLVNGLSLFLKFLFFLLSLFAKVLLHKRSSFGNIFWFCGKVSVYASNRQIV